MDTLWLVLANALAAFTYIGVAAALKGFPVPDIIFLRFLLTASAFAPFLWTGRRRLAAVGAGDWARMAVVGLAGYFLPVSLGVGGQGLSSATDAALLIGVEPACIVLLSSAFLGEELTSLRLTSLAASFLGALLIAFQGWPRLAGLFSSGRLAGEGLLFLQGAFWSLYTVVGKPVLRRVRPADFTVATSLFAFLGAAIWAGPRLSTASWSAAGFQAWLGIFYLALGGGVLALLLWNVVLRRVPASYQAHFVFLQPVAGALLGVGLLGDPFTRWTAAGGALVLAGMWAAAHA